MKTLLKAESIVPFLISVILINRLPVHFAWWMWIVLFLAPDVSMVGYAVNNKIGAYVYNLFHHQLVAVIVWIVGLLLSQQSLELAGLILLGHSSFDRVMGYGLKLNEGFKFTHLGEVGKTV